MCKERCVFECEDFPKENQMQANKATTKRLNQNKQCFLHGVVFSAFFCHYFVRNKFQKSVFRKSKVSRFNSVWMLNSDVIFFQIRNRLKVREKKCPRFVFQFRKWLKVQVKFCQKSDLSNSKFSRNFGFGTDFSALNTTYVRVCVWFRCVFKQLI